ncbi:hypothetical protein Tco_1546531 [Tanacetum coccineum]
MYYSKESGDMEAISAEEFEFKEVKEEFDKLVKQVESFTPINFEATKDSLKRFGEELQTKTSKRLKNLDKDDSEDSDEVSEQDDSASDGTDIVYINFGAMLKDITRDDLTELYRIVMNRYGMNGPEDELEKVAKLMLDKKLQGGKPYEDCYKLLKWMEKQAGIRK